MGGGLWGKEREGSSGNVYTGPMDKDSGMRIQCGRGVEGRTEEGNGGKWDN